LREVERDPDPGKYLARVVVREGPELHDKNPSQLKSTEHAKIGQIPPDQYR
jgi:hypothetical protein